MYVCNWTSPRAAACPWPAAPGSPRPWNVPDPGAFSAERLCNHPRVDARQSQKSIPENYRGIDVKSQFLQPLTLSMAPTAEPNCSSKNLGWTVTERYSSQFKNNYFAKIWSGSDEGS